jgi:putative transposon-encoded protein
MPKKKDSKIIKDSLYLSKEVELFYEKTVTRFGNSAKVDAPKSYIGRRAFVVILKS